MLLLIEPTGQVLIALMFKFDIVIPPPLIFDCHEQLSETNVLICPTGMRAHVHGCVSNVVLNLSIRAEVCV